MPYGELPDTAEAALRERVKELTCLYGIAQMAARPGRTLEQILQDLLHFLPPAWQYPEITAARIVLDGNSHATAGFCETAWKQSAPIVVEGVRRGEVEVVYLEERPELDDGPFLKEERNLIDTVARQVSLIVERRETEEEKTKLQSQLRHADRLATVGLLAAGVAHELNEPLGSILGFAQLAKKNGDLPEQSAEDIGKIEAAALHAREVIKNLLVFARQMPPEKRRVDLNEVSGRALGFFRDRCTNSGIEVVHTLECGLPEIIADPGQIHQVLVNLVVNALQAMPEGGRLTIRTMAEDRHVCLIVEDTGVGMTREEMERVCMPFYTTKDVGEGTGLGLAVVHGIVTSHSGSLEIESEPGKGSRFAVRLPADGPADMAEADRNVIV
jgi:signal transduction histidine kinase